MSEKKGDGKAITVKQAWLKACHTSLPDLKLVQKTSLPCTMITAAFLTALEQQGSSVRKRLELEARFGMLLRLPSRKRVAPGVMGPVAMNPSTNAACAFESQVTDKAAFRLIDLLKVLQKETQAVQHVVTQQMVPVSETLTQTIVFKFDNSLAAIITPKAEAAAAANPSLVFVKKTRLFNLNISMAGVPVKALDARLCTSDEFWYTDKPPLSQEELTEWKQRREKRRTRFVVGAWALDVTEVVHRPNPKQGGSGGTTTQHWEVEIELLSHDVDLLQSPDVFNAVIEEWLFLVETCSMILAIV